MNAYILILMVSLIGSAANLRGDNGSLVDEADAAYSKREDIPQAKIAMLTYARAAVSGSTRTVECFWKASRAAWWVGERSETRSEKLEYFQKGCDFAEKALIRDTNSVEGHFWLGGNMGSFGDTKGVMKSLSLVSTIRHEMQEVIRLNDRYSGGGAYHVLGVVDYKVPGLMGGSKSRAKEELDKALVIGPNEPFNHYYKAEFCKITGDIACKKSELEKLQTLQVSPDDLPELKMLRAKAELELK